MTLHPSHASTAARLARTAGAGVAAAVLVPLASAAPALAAEPAERPALTAAADGRSVSAVVRRADGRLEVRTERLPTAERARERVAQLRRERGVVTAEVDVAVRALHHPSADPYQADQWGLRAGRFTEASHTVDAGRQVVAVVDTGVDLDHPDLAARLVPGYDFVGDDSTPQDEDTAGGGHGTHVAGTVGAVAGNGIGGAGAALRTRVMPVRVLDAMGGGTSGDVASGILWAVDRGATVVNLSLGGAQYSSTVAAAVDEALSRGVPVVAASGNAGSGTPHYPAALPGVIAVGSVDRDLGRSDFSNHGSHLDLVAPGSDVLATTLTPFAPTNSYGWMSGTSMATPFVSGAVAMVRALAPTWSPAQVEAALKATARDLGAPGSDPYHGAGLVQAPSQITVKHARLGGNAGFLGPAAGAETSVPRGRARAYRSGAIWWSSTTPAAEVHGAIRTTYERTGASGGPLGLPTTDERRTPDGRGRFNHFQAGSVYWSSATGAHEVRGAIRTTWSRLGWERSGLGYPTTGERGTGDGRGRFNHFERGSVYWTSATGAHDVRGAIRTEWARLGWERSWLGYPTSGEYAVSGGRASDFEGGRLRWDSATGRVTATRS